MTTENKATSIRFENVSYIYSPDTPFEKRALDCINTEIEGGVITGLIGHTGSGKSTLVQLMNGLLKPTCGKVYVGGRDIWEDPKKIREFRFRVGLVFQYPEYQLFEETIYKDIAFGPSNMGLDEAEIKARVLESLDFVGLDASMLDKSPFDLSGGQKRRVAIAGIMAMRPEVLVLDEPAAGLDPRGREEILGGVHEYQRRSGSTVIIVSHSMEDMAKYADRLLVMKGAEVIKNGDCHEIFAESETLTSIGLDVPQITRFMKALAARGVDAPADIFTVDEAAAALLPLLRKEGGASC